MKARKDVKLGRREKFVEDIRDDYTRCPKCGGILIINFDEGISVEFCVEDNCDYEDYDYNLWLVNKRQYFKNVKGKNRSIKREMEKRLIVWLELNKN